MSGAEEMGVAAEAAALSPSGLSRSASQAEPTAANAGALLTDPISGYALASRWFRYAQNTTAPCSLFPALDELGDDHELTITVAHFREFSLLAQTALSHSGAVSGVLEALYQYRSDMLYPPAADSRERRIAMIDKLIAKVAGEA